jgi:hypothetical protein
MCAHSTPTCSPASKPVAARKPGASTPTAPTAEPHVRAFEPNLQPCVKTSRSPLAQAPAPQLPRPQNRMCAHSNPTCPHPNPTFSPASKPVPARKSRAADFPPRPGSPHSKKQTPLPPNRPANRLPASPRSTAHRTNLERQPLLFLVLTHTHRAPVCRHAPRALVERRRFPSIVSKRIQKKSRLQPCLSTAIHLPHCQRLHQETRATGNGCWKLAAVDEKWSPANPLTPSRTR